MVDRKTSNNGVVFVTVDVVFVNSDVVLTNTDAVLTLVRRSQGFSTALKAFPNGIIPKKVGMKKERPLLHLPVLCNPCIYCISCFSYISCTKDNIIENLTKVSKILSCLDTQSIRP